MKNPTIERIQKPKSYLPYLLINDRYAMYTDGAVYDMIKGGDIPQWIFEFRDFVKEKMK